MSQGIWVNGEGGEPEFLPYSEMEKETRQALIQPVGGFCFEAEAFKAMDLPCPPFYVEHWLPKRGKCLFFAPAKVGKSFLCLQLARCVGSGEEFLGHSTTQGRVLYVQFELGEEVLRERLIQTGQTYDDVYVGTSFSLKLDTTPGQKQLSDAIFAVKPVVLILDPLYKAIIGDENEAVDLRKTLDYLDCLIETYGISIVLIHHSGYDSAHSRGSTVLQDWVDAYLQIKKISKDGEDLKIKITPQLLRHAAPDQPVEAVLKNFEFEVTGGKPTVKQSILELALTLPEVTPKLVLDSGVGSNTSVAKAFLRLVEEGKLIRLGQGRYKLRG